MTQSVVAPDGAPVQTPVQNAPPEVPRISRVIEKSETTMRLVDERGQKKTVLEHHANVWAIGDPVPGDDKKATRIVNMIRTPDGVRVYVLPTDGSDAANAGLAFEVEIPIANVQLVFKVMPRAIFEDEIADAEDVFLYGVDSGASPSAEPAAEPTNGHAAIAPTSAGAS